VVSYDGIRYAAPAKHDDVFNFVTRETQTPVQLEWKILIEEYFQDAFSTAGGRGEATGAA